MAVCLHGAVRTTDDVDILVVTLDSPAVVLKSLRAAGYQPRYADPVAFAEVARVLLVRHEQTGIEVDVMLGMLPFDQECIDRSVVKRGSFGTVRVASPEALCVMKLVAGRPHDLRDVAQLIELYPRMDRDWVMTYMTQYAELMESPEALERAGEAFAAG